MATEKQKTNKSVNWSNPPGWLQALLNLVLESNPGHKAMKLNLVTKERVSCETSVFILV